ncbi:hypothetical protein ONO39_27970, partial [Salmonella enterica subsp. enterica serovar Anatum]|nr:hypothetical protein [Salmonella enterica subsp. enterica serovar Anatum]
RVGRKVTLVASLLTMGISTVIIGLLPGYATIGIFAPLLLALAQRDAENNRPLFEFLGMSVGINLPGMPAPAKREAYAADITY